MALYETLLAARLRQQSAANERNRAQLERNRMLPAQTAQRAYDIYTPIHEQKMQTARQSGQLAEALGQPEPEMRGGGALQEAARLGGQMTQAAQQQAEAKAAAERALAEMEQRAEMAKAQMQEEARGEYGLEKQAATGAYGLEKQHMGDEAAMARLMAQQKFMQDPASQAGKFSPKSMLEANPDYQAAKENFGIARNSQFNDEAREEALRRAYMHLKKIPEASEELIEQIMQSEIGGMYGAPQTSIPQEGGVDPMMEALEYLRQKYPTGGAQ